MLGAQRVAPGLMGVSEGFIAGKGMSDGHCLKSSPATLRTGWKGAGAEKGEVKRQPQMSMGGTLVALVTVEQDTGRSEYILEVGRSDRMKELGWN